MIKGNLFHNMNDFLLSLSCYLISNSNEQLTQWDSPMRVKLSMWKPCVKTLLIELLPWALLINQSKWDLWLFEGEKIVLQIPAGKIIIPPNFQVAILFKLTGATFLSVQTLFRGAYQLTWFRLFWPLSLPET